MPHFATYTWNYLDLRKLSPVKVGEVGGSWQIMDLERATGLPENNLRVAQHRKLWQPNDLESVVLFLARYGTDQLRTDMMRCTFTEAPKKPVPPGDSLESLCHWVALFGSLMVKQNIVHCALSGGGRTRLPTKRKVKA